MFVTFEGCEGVGKSTQLTFLKEYLEKTGQKALYIREPGSTDISEQIRKVILDPKNTEMDPITEAMLYAASRIQLVKQVIKPALERGELVICDRYVDSSIAYQGYARNLGADTIKEINSIAIKECMPDITIFIDLKPQDSWRKVQLEDRMEKESRDFHNKVYDGFVEEMKKSGGRIVAVKPDIDKKVTSRKIIEELIKAGAIK